MRIFNGLIAKSFKNFQKNRDTRIFILKMIKNENFQYVNIQKKIINREYR